MLFSPCVRKYTFFAIIFGNSNCGKTSLVDTLMTSRFGYTRTLPNDAFTASNLRGFTAELQEIPGGVLGNLPGETFAYFAPVVESLENRLFVF